ncbi:MAG: hypothetical protein ACJASV_001085 [Pseudorhodobacter sp.]|jgi:hypothetical protein
MKKTAEVRPPAVFFISFVTANHAEIVASWFSLRHIDQNSDLRRFI